MSLIGQPRKGFNVLAYNAQKRRQKERERLRVADARNGRAAMHNSIQWPENPVCCASSDFKREVGCVCAPMERALHGWIDGHITAPMTPEQREACLSEIDRSEGYKREDHASDTDADLSRAVLWAWTDYCRDKGLL